MDLKENKDLKLVFLCKRFDNIKKHFISYGFYTLKTMYHVATSHVCIIDSYSLPISVLKHKKDLKVMQIWHAMGAIKKFGYQTVGKTSGRKVAVIGFGTFAVQERPERQGINPATKESITIAAKKVVKFKPSAELDSAIN